MKDITFALLSRARVQVTLTFENNAEARASYNQLTEAAQSGGGVITFTNDPEPTESFVKPTVRKSWRERLKFILGAE